MPLTLHIGEVWHVPSRPDPGPAAADFLETASALVVSGDTIVDLGDVTTLQARYPDAAVMDHQGALILPGFVDTHLHFPQIDLIGSYAEGLLSWLSTYTYPREASYAQADIAKTAATRFVTELLANGVTLSAVFASSHEISADTLFAEADRRGIRSIIGKVSMNRNAPAALTQNVAEDVAANERLIARWHGRSKRLWVALTPRFALSCSEPMLAALGDLKWRHPTVYVQTHHAETHEEIAAVRSLFPQDQDYLAVYERFGLIGPRTILAHVIHPTPEEIARIVATQTKIAHCPTSNLFLGSGLFPMRQLSSAGAAIGLASDVGGGTSFSMFQTMNEAYKVQALRGEFISPTELLYLATQGGADVLGLGDQVGSLIPGKRADFQILDWRQQRLLAARFDQGATAVERLFATIMLGDDRLTRLVYVNGREVYSPTKEGGQS